MGQMGQKIVDCFVGKATDPNSGNKKGLGKLEISTYRGEYLPDLQSGNCEGAIFGRKIDEVDCSFLDFLKELYSYVLENIDNNALELFSKEKGLRKDFISYVELIDNGDVSDLIFSEVQFKVLTLIVHHFFNSIPIPLFETHEWFLNLPKRNYSKEKLISYIKIKIKKFQPSTYKIINDLFEFLDSLCKNHEETTSSYISKQFSCLLIEKDSRNDETTQKDAELVIEICINNYENMF